MVLLLLIVVFVVVLVVDDVLLRHQLSFSHHDGSCLFLSVLWSQYVDYRQEWREVEE